MFDSEKLSPLIFLVLLAGFEPRVFGSRVQRSTIELPRTLSAEVICTSKSLSVAHAKFSFRMTRQSFDEFNLKFDRCQCTSVLSRKPAELTSGHYKEHILGGPVTGKGWGWVSGRGTLTQR